MTAMNMNRNKLNVNPGNFFRRIRAVALVMTSLFLFSGGVLFAQDKAKIDAGQILFKENCATCHKIDQDLTGPALRGLEDRVPGGRKWIYGWVKNSPAIIASGDKYGTDLFAKWNKVNMTPFPNFTNEQIDNIVDYINSVPKPGEGKGGDVAEIQNLEDNEGLASMWNWIRILILIVVILLFVIAVQVTRLRGGEFLKGLNIQLWNARGWMVFYILGMAGTAWLS